MTTVIFKDGTMFADSQATELNVDEFKLFLEDNKKISKNMGKTFYDFKKIYKKDNLIYSISGCWDDNTKEQLVTWYSSNYFRRRWFNYSLCLPLCAFIWDGKVLGLIETIETKKFKNKWILKKIYKPQKTAIYFIGSGTKYARKAIRDGATAVEAIEYAAKYDLGTNNVVQSETVEYKY